MGVNGHGGFYERKACDFPLVGHALLYQQLSPGLYLLPIDGSVSTSLQHGVSVSAGL